MSTISELESPSEIYIFSRLIIYIHCFYFIGNPTSLISWYSFLYYLFIQYLYSNFHTEN